MHSRYRRAEWDWRGRLQEFLGYILGQDFLGNTGSVVKNNGGKKV